MSSDKWDEQVLRIGETVSHEKDGNHAVLANIEFFNSHVI
jgi:hypothetical protein